MARVGEFLANMLAGGLQEGQRRREEGDKLRLAQVSAQIRDPLTFLLLHQLAGGGGKLDLQDPTIRSLLGLGKTTEQIKGEEKSRKTGELEADPLQRQKEQAEMEERILKARKMAEDHITDQKKLFGILPIKRASEQEIDDYLSKNRLPLSQETAQTHAPSPTPPPPSHTPPPSSGELVSVINPEGKRVKIRRSKLDQAVSAGYVKIRRSKLDQAVSAGYQSL